MKNLTFLLCFTSISSLSFSQDLEHAWTHTWGNVDSAITPDLAVDIDGNVYAAGSFKGTIDFNPGIGSTIFTSSSGGNSPGSYISKFNSNGQFLWAKRLAATGQHVASKIVYDSDGFIYVAGYFTGSADFDPGPNVYNLTSSLFKNDMFLLKLDLNGNFVWAKSTQGNGNKTVGSISLDEQGNILAGGIFNGTADFDPGPQDVSYTSTSLMNDAFFVKYNDKGELIWAKAIFGSHRVEVTGVDVDELGNVYYIGSFDDVRDFDPGPGSLLLAAFGPWDVWVLKLNALGEFQWLRRLGNDGENFATGVLVNDHNDIFITGSFNAEMDFDQGPQINILTAINEDPFIWKMDSQGKFKWAGQFTGIRFNRANAITMDAHGDLYITGYFSDTVDFDPGPGTYHLTSTGDNNHPDGFVVRLHRDGQFVWAVQAGGLDDDVTGDLQLDPKGHIYATGGFQGRAGFFLGDTNEDSLVSTGSTDVFLTRWLQCARSYAQWNTSSCDSTYVSPSGKYIWIQSGVYQDTITNRAGCDSVLTIHLEVAALNPQVDFLGDGFFAVEENASYQWVECLKEFLVPVDGATHQSFIPTHTGSYAVILQQGECTTISDCYFFLLCEESHAEWSIISCNSSFVSPSGIFTWTQSGVYQDTIANLAGCDSILTINLELRQASNAELNITTCDTSYVSPSGKFIWTQSGIYQDTIKNLAGCDSVLTINLTAVFVNPAIIVIADGAGLAAVEQANAYQWLDCDNGNAPIDGETNREFYPTQSGNYSVLVEVLGCQAISECIFVMVTAVEKADPMDLVLLYPNPTEGGFRVQLPSRTADVEIVLYSTTGRKVLEKKFTQSDLILIEDPLQPGLYLVHVNAGGARRVFKLIVQ